MKKSIFSALLLSCSGLFGQATLPTNWDMSNVTAPPVGWSHKLDIVAGNLTYTSAGFFNSTPQSLRLDGSGEFLQIFFAGRADTVEYFVRTNPGTDPGSVFNVDESADGTTWTNVRNYNKSLPQTLTKHIVRLKSSSRYVRFIYTTKVTGFNVALDDVLVKPAGPSASPEIAVLDGTKPLINGGNFQPGNSGLFPLTLKNNGLGDSLKIDSISFSGASAQYFKIGGAPKAIAASSQTNVLVQLTGAPAGSAKATMNIYSNDGVGNQVFSVNVYAISGSYATEPNAVPSINFSTVRAWQLRVDANATNAENVLVLVSKDSITETPTDGSVYEKGSYLGKARVVTSGAAGNFRVDQIVANTRYFVKVFTWNGYGNFTNYNQSGYAISKVTTPGLNAGSYYSNVSPTDSLFISKLRSRLRTNHFQIFYSNFGTTMVEDFEAYDTTGGKRVLTCNYSGYKHLYNPPIIWDTLSREHSYPRSWMPIPSSSATDSACGTDLFALFPVHQNKTNAVRSNVPYNNLKTVTFQFLDGKYGQDSAGNLAYEPPDRAKGMMARACFYICAAYHTAAKPFTLPTSNQFISDLQDQKVLKRWNLQFPPSKYEMARQEYASFRQNSRNPFIDNPNWACYIDFSNMKYNASGDCNKISAATPKNLLKTLNMTVMPNPSSDKVSVDISAFGSQQVALLLMDVTGNVVLETKADAKITSLDISTLSSGVYMLYAHSSNAHAAVKVVKP
ncbi:MAG: endonuclease [Sphingomonadales bacterium]|jgi:hypothetical protein